MFAFTMGFLVAAAAAVFSGTQPQLAAVGERVFVAFGLGNTISVARSDDGGMTFGKPSALPVPGIMALGMHRGPRVAATNSSVLVTAVVGAKGGGADGDVLLFRSTDQGRSWGQPVAINDVPGSAREGLQTIAANPTGLVVITWLDLRAKGTRIHAAVSRDHGATWAPDVLVYASPSGSVCECCHPSVAIDNQGRIAIMFRNNLDGRRDMFVAQSADGRAFAAATKLGTGSWELNACPMDGGALVFGDGIAATWRRENDVFLSTTQTPERRLGTGRDPVMATTGTHQDVAWSTPTGVMLMRDAAKVVSVGPGRFPAILALPDKTVIAWEDKGTVTVRAIPR